MSQSQVRPFSRVTSGNICMQLQGHQKAKNRIPGAGQQACGRETDLSPGESSGNVVEAEIARGTSQPNFIYKSGDLALA